jgi:hypothetical protein
MGREKMMKKQRFEFEDKKAVFEPLPKANIGRRGSAGYAFILAPLVERPNEWARVRVFEKRYQANNTVTQLRRAFYSHPEGTKREEWEFAIREVDGKFRLYARYIKAIVMI